MEYRLKKAVMTGGSGGVGMALIKKLLSEGVEILLFQRRESPRARRLPEHPLLHVEYCPMAGLNEYVPKETGYDIFYHLGWANSYKLQHNDVELQEKNVVYAAYAARLAHRMGCHTFVGVGSQAECGRHDEPLGPDTRCEPETMYGVMKLCARHTTRNICGHLGMRHIWMRILSGYGEYDNEYSLIVSSILNSLAGRPLAFSKGEQIWDFVHMDDIANAFFLAGGGGKNNAIYTIGTGKETPLKEYIEILCEKLGEDPAGTIGRLPYADGQIMHLSADTANLREDTGWKQEIDFGDGIERTIEFYKKHVEYWEKRF